LAKAGLNQPTATTDLLLVEGSPLTDKACQLGQGDLLVSIMMEGKFDKQTLPVQI